MKVYTKLLVIPAILFFFAACSKDNTESAGLSADPSVLTGKWKLSETRMDIGDGKSEWKPVEKGTDKYLEFKENGSLSGNTFPNYPLYSLKDSSIIMFKEADGIKYQNYRYELKDGKLSMSPAGPIWCIEACGGRYIKVE